MCAGYVCPGDAPPPSLYHLPLTVPPSIRIAMSGYKHTLRIGTPFYLAGRAQLLSLPVATWDTGEPWTHETTAALL